MIQRTWRVYGLAGHRQAASFGRPIDPAYEGGRVHVSIRNADKTGTNEYSEVQISAETAEDCEHGLDAQLNDGSFFENCRIGRVHEVSAWDKPTEDKQQICDKLLGTLICTRDQRDLAALTYTRDAMKNIETVTAVYEGGTSQRINVSLDSGCAMIRDIMQALR